MLHGGRGVQLGVDRSVIVELACILDAPSFDCHVRDDAWEIHCVKIRFLHIIAARVGKPVVSIHAAAMTAGHPSEDRRSGRTPGSRTLKGISRPVWART